MYQQNYRTMAVSVIEPWWQLGCEKVQQRCGYLLTSGLWSDCTFMVGPQTNQEVIQAHKLLLAMASPVFEAMLYGKLSDPMVSISDVQPEVFRALLEYIYTSVVNIGSLNMACDLWYAAKKYMLPHLVKPCISYICTKVGPGTACQTYELAHLLEEKTVMDKCIEVISTKTKEVLNDDSFVDVQLNTLVKVCSLYHLDVESELDLFNAVARYAEAEQRKQGETSPPVGGGPSSKGLPKKELQSEESSSQTRSAVGPDSKPPSEVVPSKPTADKQHFEEEEPSIRAALQKLRFLSLSGAQFAEGPARSALLTKDEKLAVLMNIASGDSPMPMPTGFSVCREQRQPRRVLKRTFDAGSLDHIISSLLCGDHSQVMYAAKNSADFLLGTPLDIQPALDKGILDALIPALTNWDDKCKSYAARCIYYVCEYASPMQLRVLAEGDALQPFCRLLAATEGDIAYWVLRGLTGLLTKVKEKSKPDLFKRMRAFGVPQLLEIVRHCLNEQCRVLADGLLQTYFNDH